MRLIANKSLKYVPALRASTGRSKAAPLSSDVMVSTTKTAILLLILGLSPVLAQDYEAQLSHRKGAIVEALEEAARSEESATIEFECIAHSRQLAERFIQFHSPKDSRIEMVGDNQFRAIVAFDLELETLDFDQWLRTQFFIAISYHCNMDAVRPVAHHNKSLKYVPALRASTGRG